MSHDLAPSGIKLSTGKKKSISTNAGKCNHLYSSSLLCWSVLQHWQNIQLQFSEAAPLHCLYLTTITFPFKCYPRCFFTKQPPRGEWTGWVHECGEPTGYLWSPLAGRLKGFAFDFKINNREYKILAPSFEISLSQFLNTGRYSCWRRCNCLRYDKLWGNITM